VLYPLSYAHALPIVGPCTPRCRTFPLSPCPRKGGIAVTYSVLSGITPAFNNYNVKGLGWPIGNTSVIVPYSYKGTPFPGGVHRDTVPLWNALLDGLTGPLGVKLITPGCWGYNNRSITGGGAPSFHSGGLALDVNAPSNPYVASGKNAAHTIPPGANDLARSLGMEWGGAWTSPKDFMHFEIHLTPAQVKTVSARLAGAPAPVPVPAPSGGDLSAQFESDARKRWPEEDQLDKDTRADLHAKQLQLDRIEAALAVLAKKVDALSVQKQT
jgi:hypothetical protein